MLGVEEGLVNLEYLLKIWFHRVSILLSAFVEFGGCIALYLLMDFPIQVDRTRMGLSIICVKGHSSSSLFAKLCFYFLEDCIYFNNRCRP